MIGETDTAALDVGQRLVLLGKLSPREGQITLRLTQGQAVFLGKTLQQAEDSLGEVLACRHMRALRRARGREEVGSYAMWFVTGLCASEVSRALLLLLSGWLP